jgi:polyhydroxyalkanoate synthesis regulator protein
LLQIISEQEHDGEPFFSTSALSQIIRFYDDSMQGVAGDFIQKSLELFVDQQKQLQDAVTTNPLTAMNDIAEKNLKIWQDMQEGFIKATGLDTEKK